MIKWLDHMIIAVNSLEEAIPKYQKFGFKLERRNENTADGMRSAAFILDQGRALMLAEPTGPETPVARFLSRRGEGVYLIAMAVDDLDQAIQEAKAQEVNVIEDTWEGGRLILIHPREAHGILFQLVERKES